MNLRNKTQKWTGVCALFGITLLLSIVLQAQQPPAPPIAPVPAQIFSAKKVFISNASALGETPSGVADLTYNEFYADIKDWGRYEIVSAPVDADLVFEIRFTSEIGAKNVVNELAALRRIFSFAWLFLIPKRAPSCGPSRRACPKRPIVRPAEKKIDDAMTAIVNDVKKLTSQPAAANGPAAK